MVRNLFASYPVSFFIIGFIVMLLLTFSCATFFVDDKESTPVKPYKPRVVLKWRTESESDNYGYNVYRGDSPEGPFKKINSQIIPGAGTTGTPHEYTYIDYDVEKGKTYYYYLESVSLTGVKEKFSQIIEQQVPSQKP